MTPEVLTPFALEFWIDTGVALFCGAKDWREDHPTQWITIDTISCACCYGLFGLMPSASAVISATFAQTSTPTALRRL